MPGVKRKNPLRAIHSEEGRNKIEKDILEKAQFNRGQSQPLSLKEHLEASRSPRNVLSHLLANVPEKAAYLPTLLHHITITEYLKKDAIYLAENYGNQK